MAIDHYLRLGVSRKADKDSIKRAYRKAAKSCHPDLDVDCGDADQFRHLHEAYETLSDTDKRKAYDARLKIDEGDAVPVHRMAPAPRADATPRPSDGERYAAPPASFFSGIAPFHNFGHDAVHLEAILSPQEASRGGAFSLPIEVASRCPWCGDAFPFFGFRRLRCSACGGTGRIRQRRHLPFHIPSGVPHGSVLTLSDPSLPEIRVRILIDE